MTIVATPTIEQADFETHVNGQLYEGMFVSKERYWAEFYEDTNLEWKNGYLEVKPMASLAEYKVYRWYTRLMEIFLGVYPIALTIGLETAFEMVLSNGTAIRKPDMAVILHTNPVPFTELDRRYWGIFDICVESISASSSGSIARDTKTKYAEYEAAGVQEYHLLDERGLDMLFLHLVNGTYQPLPEVDGVVQSIVLPGFQFRRADLYRRPSLIELSADPVYQAYVLPEYQQARQEVETMQQQLDAARQEKERERQEKERLAAKLRALGIDPSEV